MGAGEFWGAVAVFVVLMWTLAFWMRKRRAAALRTVADELNLEFIPTEERSFIHRLAGFDLQSRYPSFGNSPVQNLMRRLSDGKEITIFDYRCRKVHSSDNPTTMTVLLLEWPELALPTFTARPESVFQKLGHVLGGQDIDFPDHPEFSRRYVLRGENEDEIRSMMTDEVIRAFEAHTGMGVSGISVEGSGSKLIVYYFLRTVGAAGLRDFIAAALDIAEPLAKASGNQRDVPV